MFNNTIKFTINWGDCDPAFITFYPNYFKWFDEGTWALFRKAGCDPALLLSERGVYIRLVDAQARFKQPGFVGDTVELESYVSEWRKRFFTVKHFLRRDKELLLEGTEIRAWVTRHPEDTRRFKPVAIPEDVRGALSIDC